MMFKRSFLVLMTLFFDFSQTSWTSLPFFSHRHDERYWVFCSFCFLSWDFCFLGSVAPDSLYKTFQFCPLPWLLNIHSLIARWHVLIFLSFLLAFKFIVSQNKIISFPFLLCLNLFSSWFMVCLSGSLIGLHVIFLYVGLRLFLWYRLNIINRDSSLSSLTSYLFWLQKSCFLTQEFFFFHSYYTSTSCRTLFSLFRTPRVVSSLNFLSQIFHINILKWNSDQEYSLFKSHKKVF